MVVKNGKSPATKRQAASSSSRSKRSNTVSKNLATGAKRTATDELDGDFDAGKTATLESEAGDRILEKTGIDAGTPRDAVSTESVELTAITLHQPWASLIAAGKKQYETRSWATDYRGPIAIHSAKRVNSCRPELLKLLNIESLDELPAGSIVAIAQLTDCIKMTDSFIDSQSDIELNCGDWEAGRYAWKLENVRAIEPIPATGKQGLWKWASDELEKEEGRRKKEEGSWNPDDFGEVQHAIESDGQLNLLEWDVNEPPEPDDYESIELFDEAYKQWEDSQQSTVNSQQLLRTEPPNPKDYECREQFEEDYRNWVAAQPDGSLENFEEAEIWNQLMDGSICAVESAPASPMLVSNCGEDNLINSAKEMATAATSSSLDIPHQTESLQMSITLTMTGKQTSLQPLPLVSHFQLKENDSQQLTIEIASQESLQQSEITSQNSPSLKTSLAYSTALTPPVERQEATLATSSIAYRQAGTMRNGSVSGVMNSPLRGVGKEFLLLRSPGALSSGGKVSPPWKDQVRESIAGIEPDFTIRSRGPGIPRKWLQSADRIQQSTGEPNSARTSASPGVAVTDRTGSSPGVAVTDRPQIGVASRDGDNRDRRSALGNALDWRVAAVGLKRVEYLSELAAKHRSADEN